MNWFCSALAFGDFLIDCSFMRYAGSDDSILAASYLKPLATALDYQGNIKYFDMPVTDIPPSLFNARRAKVPAMIRSLFLLRGGIQNSVSSDDTIYVPLEDLRWQLACLPRFPRSLRKRDENIYLAYCFHFGLDAESLVLPVSNKPSTVLVLPDSRQAHKTIPDTTILLIQKANADVGIKSLIVRVRPPDLDSVILENEISIWGLSALVELLRNAEAVVSADSLPAHIAEYFKRPVFVITPQPNQSLMPLSVLLRQRWSGFTDLGGYKKWIEHANT